MKSVRLFFLLLTTAAMTHTSAAKSAPLDVSLAPCSIRFPIQGTAKVLRRGNNWALLKREYKGKAGARLIVRCKQNRHHTSLTSDLRAIARKRLHVLRYYQETKIDQSIPAVYYLKSRVHRGRRIISIDAYFATREFEYHLNLLPDKKPDAKTRPNQYKHLVGDMGAVLRDLRFTTQVKPAITEAAYRRRLNWLIFGGTVIVLSIGLGLYVRRRKRKEKASRRKRNEKRNGRRKTSAEDADRKAREDDSHD